MYAPLAAIILVLASAAAGLAQPCRIATAGTDVFAGETPPTDKTHFRWSAERYPMPGNTALMETRHTVENLHGWNLAFDWPAVGFQMPYTNPLAAGQPPACWLDQGQFAADSDAVIVTSNDGTKNAVAFVPARQAAGNERTAGAQVIVDDDGTRAGFLLRWFPSDRFLSILFYPGAKEYEVAVAPEALGVPVAQFVEALQGQGVALKAEGAIADLAGGALAGRILEEAARTAPYVRMAGDAPVELRFGGIDTLPTAPATFLVFDRRGSLAFVKQLPMGVLGDPE